MGLFDEVVARTKKVVADQKTEKARQEQEFNEKVSKEVARRREKLISGARNLIKKQAGLGKASCLIKIGECKWEPGFKNFEYTTNKKLCSILIDWLDSEGFTDIENASKSRRLSGDVSCDIIQIKVEW
jgi:hypothetical protein